MTKNPLICDLETGVCGVADDDGIEVVDLYQKQTIDVYYVTDPICSHCWALEPVLRRFKWQYGHYFHFHTVMGGLLEKWSGGPVDPTNGIYGPADVATHWREVGEQTRMPIDGSLMIDNPVQSSYPPSRVFKIIQNKYNDKLAYAFLRRAREALFAFNKNIGEKSIMIDIVNSLGLTGEAIVNEAESPIGEQLLQEDFALAGRLGARGFPTIMMVNEEKKGIKLVGSRSLENYISGLAKLLSDEEIEPKQQPSLSHLLQHEKLLFSKEIEVMYDLQPSDLPTFVERELAQVNFEEKELLGEKYFTVK